MWKGLLAVLPGHSTLHSITRACIRHIIRSTNMNTGIWKSYWHSFGAVWHLCCPWKKNKLHHSISLGAKLLCLSLSCIRHNRQYQARADAWTDQRTDRPADTNGWMDRWMFPSLIILHPVDILRYFLAAPFCHFYEPLNFRIANRSTFEFAYSVKRFDWCGKCNADFIIVFSVEWLKILLMSK